MTLIDTPTLSAAAFAAERRLCCRHHPKTAGPVRQAVYIESRRQRDQRQRAHRMPRADRRRAAPDAAPLPGLSFRFGNQIGGFAERTRVEFVTLHGIFGGVTSGMTHRMPPVYCRGALVAEVHGELSVGSFQVVNLRS